MQSPISTAGTALRSSHSISAGPQYSFTSAPRRYNAPHTQPNPPPPPSQASANHVTSSTLSSSGSGSFSSDSSSSTTTKMIQSPESVVAQPFAVRHGRRYAKDPTLTYPLPCDAAELHRQIFRTLLLNDVFGAPLCSPGIQQNPPTKVLEIACGTGIWSSLCHEYFTRLGYPHVSFTGIDIAPLAPDLTEQGVNWHFIRHDLRKMPLPFADGEFDLVFVKDLSMVTPITGFQERLMTEYLRVLKTGGIIEAWDSDHVLRTLTGPPALVGAAKQFKEQVDKTATYHLTPGTSFGAAQNPYIKDYNSWLQKALDQKRLTSCPCTLIGPLMIQEVDDLEVVGSRRVAILFGEVRWEREGIGNRDSKGALKKGRGRPVGKTVTRTQMALRRGALLTVIQMMESMEPLLRTASGKSQEEWDHWWGSMMEDLLDNNGTSAGECLEVGAWWGRKM